MDNLSNSFKQKELAAAKMPEKVQPVTSIVEPKAPKKGFLAKLVDTFVSVDPKVVGKNIYDNIIVPAAKRTFITAVTSGLSQMFNINVTPQTVNSIFGTQTTGTQFGFTNYGGYFNQSMMQQPQPAQQSVIAPKPVSGMDRYAMFRYQSQSAATTAIESMSDLADRYDKAIAVGYLCQFVGQPDTPTDYTFGWTKESIARAKPFLGMDGGWYISWPKPMPIAQ